jgi:hypothetical protein
MQGVTDNPVFTFHVETNPRFTNVSEDDDLVFGGELAAMDFKASLYQHDAHLKAVMLPPWSYTKVGSSAAGDQD